MADFDIGVMPLPKEVWSEGKYGLKLLQYMSMQIPSVASATQANCDIVADGEDGFLASTDEEWREKLSLLIADEKIRKEIGARARVKVLESYSLERAAPQLVEILQSVAQKSRIPVHV